MNLLAISFLFCRCAENWLFTNRRWLSPADPTDLGCLNANYDRLCADFPVFFTMPRDIFLSHLFHVSTLWATFQLKTSKCSRLATGLAIYDAPKLSMSQGAGEWHSWQCSQKNVRAGTLCLPLLGAPGFQWQLGSLGAPGDEEPAGSSSFPSSAAAAAIAVPCLLNPSL